MSRNSAARSSSRLALRTLLLAIATFTVAAVPAVLAGLLALGLCLTVPYFVAASTETVNVLLQQPATTSSVPAYVWWVSTIAGIIIGIRITVLVFWKVAPIADRYLDDRFGGKPPTYPLDNTDTY